MNRLVLSTLFASLVLLGCTQHRHLAGQSPLPTLQWYVEHYGQFSTPEGESFLYELLQRLKSGSSTRIIILASEDPMAFTAGGGFIVISAGLIQSLRNEAELAFILAHELSHEILEHTSSDTFLFPDDATREAKQRLEVQADTNALMMLMRAHYDPHAALGCLRHTYSAFPDLRYSASHPELETRITSLSELIRKSGWIPPGTIDTREFRIFKKIFDATAR